MNAPRLKGVLFDLDDTLIDWAGWSGNWQHLDHPRLQHVYELCATRGYALNATLEVFANYYARKTAEAWADARTSLRAPHQGHILMEAIAHFGVPIAPYETPTPIALPASASPDDAIRLDECLAAYGKDYGTIEGVTCFPDVGEFLVHLLDRDIQIGIVTNASQPFSLRERELVVHGLDGYFAASPCKISAADVGYLKPHPRIFEHALELMGTTPEETIYIGDNPVADIVGAQSAGMRAILRINGATPPLISGLIVPDRAINTFDELPFVFDEWYGGWG